MAFINADGSAAVGTGGGPVVPAQTAVPANTATTISFGQPVSRVVIQNNTAAAIQRGYAGPATAGSYAIPAGGTVVDQVVTGSVSLLSSGAATVNGTAAGGIVVEGYL